jgi:short-subunit dehydrogenase
VSNPPLAVVTGASSGIGAAFSSALAGHGYHVLAIARRADRLAELSTAAAGRVTALPLDLATPDATDAVLDHARGIGPVDLLVSNAGRGVHGRAWDIPRDATAGMVRLNITAGLDLATALLPEMISRRRGGLIFVTSAGGFYPTPYLAAYGATKAFLLSYAEALATELRGTGVRAMALCPGPVSTEFGERAGMADLMAKAPGLMTADDVVASALTAWRAGRTIHVPGTANAAMTAVLARLPRALTRRAMERAFRR